jgi:beta-glucanase (GH16 family)
MSLFLFAGGNAAAQKGFTKLIWSDEFNTEGLPDSSKWGYDIGTGCPNNCGWGNNELEYYTVARSENARVTKGKLVIEARKESFEGADYTSARLVSKNKFAFKYGRVETSAKLPAGIGTWPAIWMLGANIDSVDWPSCGEIDIMEHRGRELDKIFGTLHYPGRSGDNANGNTIMIKNATTEFHKYAMEWTEKNLKFFVDGKLFHEVVNSESIPFNHTFSLILNLAIGGNFAGPVDPAFKGAAMEIEYIRVYQ